MKKEKYMRKWAILLIVGILMTAFISVAMAELKLTPTSIDSEYYTKYNQKKYTYDSLTNFGTLVPIWITLFVILFISSKDGERYFTPETKIPKSRRR